MTLSPAAYAQAVSSCNDDPGFHALDFWLGSWNVFVGDTLVGTNRVTKVLNGCAVNEDWHDADGSQGEPLLLPALDAAVEAGVGDRAGPRARRAQGKAPGGAPARRGTRFRGEIPLPDGRIVQDRTTLTPEGNGDVHQVIEVSHDGGASWRVTFDARYRHAAGT